MTREPETELIVECDGPVLSVTFNRPKQHNAMTWAMYQGLYDACEEADANPDIRVMQLRGAGSRSFVSGTDITQFASFRDGQDGIAYEQKVARVLNRLEDVQVPTLAIVTGYCVGGGLAIAAVCDLRIATPRSRFGVPIARTLGNCLSMNTYSLLVHHLGPARTMDLLLRGQLIDAQQAHAAGFVAEIHNDDAIDSASQQVVSVLLSHAPLSMWAAKEALRRLRRAHLPDGDDIVARVFASNDFHDAVRAFSSKQAATWSGS